MGIMIGISMRVFADDLGGGYSIEPHDGWYVQEFQGLPYKIVITDPIEGFAPNLNIVDEKSSATLDEYVQTNIDYMAQGLQGFKEVEKKSFSAINSQGVKLIIENQQQGYSLRQTFYIFDAGNDKKVTVTCSAPLQHAQSLDAEFDNMMKTFFIK